METAEKNIIEETIEEEIENEELSSIDCEFVFNSVVEYNNLIKSNPEAAARGMKLSARVLNLVRGLERAGWWNMKGDQAWDWCMERVDGFTEWEKTAMVTKAMKIVACI